MESKLTVTNSARMAIAKVRTMVLAKEIIWIRSWL